jgi:hypothetical protein
MIEWASTSSLDGSLAAGHWPLSALAVGFVSPAFAIAGALLVAIPIIIHILNRRRFKTVTWAAMEFLLRALRKNRRRLQFEQWILLATRCAVLLLAGLALARPIACSDSSIAGLAASRSGLHVIVLDNSYSMNYRSDRPEAPTNLDHAKQLAKRLVERLSAGGESVVLITASSPAQAIISEPNYDLSAVAAAIERIEPTARGTDLPGALQLAADVIRGDRQPHKYLHLITDGTRSAWEVDSAEAMKELGRQIARSARISHLHVGRPDQANFAAVGLRPGGKLVHRFSRDLIADVRGFGASAESTLVWKIDNATIPGSSAVRLDAEPMPVTQTQAVFRTGGPHAVTAQLSIDDRLPIDNTRYRVVDVANELKVLIVEGERGMGSLAGSAAFLALALAPPSEGSMEGRSTSSYVQPEVIGELELSNKVLPDYRCVMLAGVGNLSPQQADQLEKFVRQGGTLWIFMGEQVNAENYNSVLLPRKLMPGALSRRISITSDQQGFRFDFKPQGVVHPYLSVFRGQESSGLETAAVFTYWQMDPSEEGVERVLDYQKQGDTVDPAITAHPLGSGRVVWLSTTAGPEWTSLPAKPAYLTLIHELLSGSVESGDAWMNLTVGDALTVPGTVRLGAAPVLLDAQQKAVPLEQTTIDGRTVYRSAPLTQPGLYTLQTGRRNYPIAVNVPQGEADVRVLEAPAIKAALGDVELEAIFDELPVVTASSENRGDLGWSVMLLVLALLMTEAWMAMRFGHHRMKKPLVVRNS